jgi:hypothetical protein
MKFANKINIYLFSSSHLSVPVLPEQPVVLDRWGGPLNGSKIGPVHENDDIMLSCRVVGGRKFFKLSSFCQ